jgi:hypothetical protein
VLGRLTAGNIRKDTSLHLKQLQLNPETFSVKNGVKTEILTSRGAGTLKYKDFLKYARRDSKTFRTNDAR